MTTTEIRKITAGLTTADWFNNVEVTINYPHIKFSQNFKGFSTIHKFISQQVDGWNKYENLPKELEQSKNHFNNLKNRLVKFINSYHTQNEQTLNSHWNTERSQIQSNSNYFTYDCPQIDFLIEIHKINTSAYPGAYNFIIGSHRTNNKFEFTGAIMAYEFEFKDQTEITTRRNKEKSSITKLRNDFRAQLTESETQLSGHLTKANSEYSDYVEKLDELKSEKETNFQEWFDKSKEEFTSFDTDSKTKISDLEKTYEELLRLKKPAEYWSSRAVTLKKEGWKAVNWLIGLVAFACITLYLLLWLTPEGMLLSFIKGNAQAIKWSIIYITFISFLAFGIRTLNKIAFSSFHLARDSEEREQLTYVYLALIKDGAVDEKDKNLIMQSLFSRADTGLLKDDSAPTMPNDMVGKLLMK